MAHSIEQGKLKDKVTNPNQDLTDGKPAVFGSVKVGDYAHGKLHKDSPGKEVITHAKFDKEAPSKQKEALDKEPRKTPAPKSTQLRISRE